MLSEVSIVEFLIVQLSVAFSPGLIIALIINESVQKGRKNGIQVALGSALGGLIITLVSAFTISYIFNLVPQFLNLIYIVGTIYIVYKGVSTFNSKIKNEIKKNLQRSFIAGLKLNLVNPKMWLFYLTILPVFILNEIDILNKLIILGLITVLINLFADISYAYLSNFFFQSSSIKTKRLINKISGITLIGLGLYIAISRLS
jgi:threonine/homoserine/homoserine lactone efflux protein